MESPGRTRMVRADTGIALARTTSATATNGRAMEGLLPRLVASMSLIAGASTYKAHAPQRAMPGRSLTPTRPCPLKALRGPLVRCRRARVRHRAARVAGGERAARVETWRATGLRVARRRGGVPARLAASPRRGTLGGDPLAARVRGTRRHGDRALSLPGGD